MQVGYQMAGFSCHTTLKKIKEILHLTSQHISHGNHKRLCEWSAGLKLRRPALISVRIPFFISLTLCINGNNYADLLYKAPENLQLQMFLNM